MAEDPPRPTLLPAFLSEWMFVTTMTPPTASGQVRMNNNNQKNVTLLWIDEVTANGNDATPYLEALKTGKDIKLTDIADPAKWQTYTITAPPIDKGTYLECPVIWKAGGLTLLAARVVIDLPLVNVSTAITGFSLATAIGHVGITGQLVTRDFAYPFQGEVYTSPGMTLRQYYVGQAIVGFLSSGGSMANLIGRGADYCFQVADSMIAFEERERAGYQRPPVGADPKAPAQVAERQATAKVTRLAGRPRV